MTNDEVQGIIDRAEDEYDRLKDRVHEQYDEIKRLKEEYVMLQNASDEVEEEKDKEIERLNNIINRTTKYVESLSSSGRGCDIYEDIKQEILKELKGSDK